LELDRAGIDSAPLAVAGVSGRNAEHTPRPDDTPLAHPNAAQLKFQNVFRACQVCALILHIGGSILPPGAQRLRVIDDVARTLAAAFARRRAPRFALELPDSASISEDVTVLVPWWSGGDQ
jgi:hypothetical protein